jgi:hypothetical protein
MLVDLAGSDQGKDPVRALTGSGMSAQATPRFSSSPIGGIMGHVRPRPEDHLRRDAPAGVATPKVRQEGETTIYPIVEEILFMERRSRKKYHVRALDRPPQGDGQVALSGSRRHAASRRYR